MNYGIYEAFAAKNGTYFITDCCRNEMYSVNGPTIYHGTRCPKCSMGGRNTVLYMRGTEEANKIIADRGLRLQVIKRSK